MGNVIILHCVPANAMSAAQRINGFVQYLSEFGYHVIVVEQKYSFGNINYTSKKDADIISFDASNMISQLRFTGQETRLFHFLKAAFNRVLSSLQFDANSRWRRHAQRYVEGIIKKQEIDFIISTFNPVAPHCAALGVKKSFPKIIWIADMRDEMSAAPTLTVIDRWRMRMLEYNVINTADAVTSVSKPLLTQFKKHSNRDIWFREIRNGYNYEKSEHLEKRRTPKPGEPYVIRYFGSFYGEIDPKSFLTAASQIIGQIPSIKIEFIGPKKKFNVPDNLSHAVVFRNAMPYQNAIDLMKYSNLLLLILPKKRIGVYSGKIFEYMASGVPILGLVPVNDVAADLVIKARAGYVIDKDDIPSIKKSILLAYSRWLEGAEQEADQEVVRIHHRREQVRRLVGLMTELSAERSRGMRNVNDDDKSTRNNV